ncbi:MAG: hypothetical protein WDM91_20440 [Rhizomicrobium sp.]
MAQVLAFPGLVGRAGRNPRGAVRAPAAWSERPSAYDKRNIDLYARLLDEEAAGSSEEDMARELLHLDLRDDRARAVLRWHLKRAHWIAETLSALLAW